MKCVIGRPPVSVGLFHLNVTDLLSKSTIPAKLKWVLKKQRASKKYWSHRVLLARLAACKEPRPSPAPTEEKNIELFRLKKQTKVLGSALADYFFTWTGGDSPSLLIAYTSNLKKNNCSKTVLHFLIKTWMILFRTCKGGRASSSWRWLRRWVRSPRRQWSTRCNRGPSSWTGMDDLDGWLRIETWADSGWWGCLHHPLGDSTTVWHARLAPFHFIIPQHTDDHRHLIWLEQPWFAWYVEHVHETSCFKAESEDCFEEAVHASHYLPMYDDGSIGDGWQ